MRAIFKGRGLVVLFIFICALILAACGGDKLVAPAGGELTEKDLALDKYYQSLKWYNNTIENLMSNVALLSAEQKQEWIPKADKIKQSADAALSGWKLAIDSEDYAELSANRQKFKLLKNDLVDLLATLAAEFD